MSRLIRPPFPNPKTRKTPQQEFQERIDRAQEDRLAELELNADRQDKRARATLRLGQFQTEFGARVGNWLTAAKDIGSAYRIAFEKHKEVVNRQASSDALDIQIVFSVLTVLTAGGLSWVGRIAQASQNPLLKTMAQGVESAAQAAADKVYGTAGPLVFPASLDGGVNTDPQVFQNELEKKILAVEQVALKGFGVIYNTWHNAALSSWDGYREADQLAIHGRWKDQADRLIGGDQLPKVQDIADELETGLWAKYILEEHSHLELPGVGWKITDEAHDYVGDVIYERLVQLNVTAAAGLPNRIPRKSARTHWEVGQAIGDAITKLVKWAKQYQPRDLVAMRFPTRPR